MTHDEHIEQVKVVDWCKANNIFIFSMVIQSTFHNEFGFF